MGNEIEYTLVGDKLKGGWLQHVLDQAMSRLQRLRTSAALPASSAQPCPFPAWRLVLQAASSPSAATSCRPGTSLPVSVRASISLVQEGICARIAPGTVP